MNRLIGLLLLAGLTAVLLFGLPGVHAQAPVTFYYVVKAVDANGKTSVASNEATAVVPVADDHVNLAWTASVPGSDTAVEYFVYRGTATGAESSTPLNSAAVTTLSYTDTLPIPNAPGSLTATPVP